MLPNHECKNFYHKSYSFFFLLKITEATFTDVLQFVLLHHLIDLDFADLRGILFTVIFSFNLNTNIS